MKCDKIMRVEKDGFDDDDDDGNDYTIRATKSDILIGG